MTSDVYWACQRRSTRASDKLSRTTLADLGAGVSSTESSPFHQTVVRQPSRLAAATQSRPSVTSAAGTCTSNLSGSVASGLLVATCRPESSASVATGATAFNDVFHGVDPDMNNTPPQADDSVSASERLGCLQFKLSYDFQVFPSSRNYSFLCAYVSVFIEVAYSKTKTFCSGYLLRHLIRYQGCAILPPLLPFH